MNLNRIKVAEVKVPAGKSEVIVFDDDVPLFGLRVRAGGGTTWIFQYRQGGKQRRISFGSATAMGVQEARKQAERLHAQVKLGHDPAGQKAESRARAAEVFEAVLAPYLAAKERALKPRSYVEVTRHLEKHAKPLHGLQLGKIDRRTIAGLLTDITANNGPTESNHVRGSLSAFFSWAMREGLVESNPVIGTNKAAENAARERVLSDDELRAIWNALPTDDDYGDIVKLLALTGQRRDEIGGLLWSEINLDDAMVSLPGERTKNNKPHLIPLSATARVLLRRRYRDDSRRPHVFGVGAGGYSGWSKSKEALDKRLSEAGKKLPQWTPHDLRRTMSTRMHDELGVQPHIVEACLNHVSGHRNGIAGVYNRAEYLKEKSAALRLWGEHLTAIVAGKRAKVVPMTRKRGK
jgi:integrase